MLYGSYMCKKNFMIHMQALIIKVLIQLDEAYTTSDTKSNSLAH